MSYTPELMTVGEVAERLSCSREHVYKRIESGALPAIRIGPKGLRVDAVDLAEYLELQNAGRARWNEGRRAASIETRS